jgi:hypothetical protein
VVERRTSAGSARYGAVVRYRRRLRPTLAFAGFLAAVTALTLAQRAGAFPLSAIAATPDSFWDGRLWLLLTSAPVAQSPLSLSLISLVAVALAVLWICGSRVLWLSAVIGHAGSTLVLYAAIGALALADRDTVSNLLSEEDYGVSAIFAAWLGAASARCWLRRRGAWAEKLGVVLVGLGTGLVAWLVRGEPTPSVLDSEHIVAFAVGAAIATAPLRSRPALIST